MQQTIPKINLNRIKYEYFQRKVIIRVISNLHSTKPELCKPLQRKGYFQDAFKTRFWWTNI